nr:hypothetical protein [Stenotrophomonas pavanii]
MHTLTDPHLLNDIAEIGRIEGRQGFMQKTAVQLIHSESLRSIMPATG